MFVITGNPMPGSHQHLAPTSATHLTPPPGAKLAVFSISTATVYYLDDGTVPTGAGVGTPLPAGTIIGYASRFDLIQFISATGTVDISYYGN